MQARVVLYLLPLVAALSIGAAEAQRIQWGNYLVTEELLLFPEVNVGAALCSLESNFSSPGLRLGIGGAWTVSENLFDADGTSVSSQKWESTPGVDDVIAPLTDLNGDGRLEIGFSGDVEFLRQRVYIGSHTSEGFINTTNLLTLDPSQPPLSHFSVLQQRYNTSNYAFGLSVTFVGDVDNNGVGDIAISGGHTSSYTATAFHILFLDKNLEVLNVTTITLFPDESIAAFAINSELGVDPTSFASSIAGIGDVDGDNIPDMAATAETGEGTLLFILFLTPEGNVKEYRVHSTESVYSPPGITQLQRQELWNWGIIKSMGVEAALTEAERFSSADYNNDQHPDLILASLQMGDTWLLFLDDKGNIIGNMYHGTGIQREGSGVAVVDANDDSVPDIVLSKDFPVDQGTIKVLLMDAIRITVTSASFSEEEEEEEEGEDPQTRTLLATFQVELSARPKFAIQVDFQVETSDNISDEDVVLLSPSPLNFEVGQTSTVVQVSVVLPVEEVINRRQQQEPTIALVLTSAMNALVDSSSNSFLLSLVNSEESSNNDDEDSSDKETNIIVPIVVTIVVVLLVILAGVGLGIWWRRRKMQVQKRMRVDSQYGVMEGGNHPKRDDDEEEDEDEGIEMKSGDLWNIAYHKLTFVEKIGEGAFGEVWKGMWRNSEVAIKKLHTMDDDQLQDFQTEAQTLKGLRPHGNVIQLLGVVNEPDNPFCIVTEFMDKGDLNSYLLQHKDSIDADTMLKWAIDIASGMHHLHSEGITHRDLATRNLLLTKALRLKVADFGMSRKMDKKGGAQKTTNDVGPLKWMAPEAIEDHIYSEKSDVWSFGVCLWEIASFGAVPFEGLSAVNAAVKVCQQREALEPPENSPPVLREVMLTCWAFSPEDRPNFGAILQTLKEATL